MENNPLITKLIKVMEHEVGVKEIGHTNLGRRVEEYQHADFLPGVGYAWCASFFGWCMLTTLGQSLCDKVWYRSASCDEILDWGRRHNIVSDTPIKGCAALVMAHGSENNATHTFGVEEVLSNGIKCIEGNSNLTGAREGDGVYRRFRKYSARYKYIQWMKLLPRGIKIPETPVVVHSKPIPPSPFTGSPQWDLYSINGEHRAVMPYLHGHNYIEAWRWAEWCKGSREHADLKWNVPTQTVSINGKEIPIQPLLFNGRSWIPIKTLADTFGRTLTFDSVKERVYIK